MANVRYRDAVTGEWVSPEYAAENPSTTVGETVNEDEPREEDE